MTKEKGETEPAEVTLAVGVDKEAKRVVLTLEVTGGTPIKARFMYTPREVGELCVSLVSAAKSLEEPVVNGRIALPAGRVVRFPGA